MTAFVEWEGIGPITATEVHVIGTTTAIDIVLDQAGSPPPAEIIFRNPADPGVDPAVIAGQQSNNAMDLSLDSGLDSNGKSAGIVISGTYLNLQHDSTAIPPIGTTRIKLVDGEIRTIGEIIVEGETWHTPALAAGWSQLPGYIGIAYRLGTENNVEFKGTIHNGVVADNTQIMTLPVGYRPQASVLLRPPVGPSGSGNAGSSRIFIVNTGGVFIYGMTAVTDIGFDNLGFSLEL